MDDAESSDEDRRRERRKFREDHPDPRDRRDADLRRAANRNPAPPLKVSTLAELASEPEAPRLWLIEPVLPQDGLMLLYGRRGSGKTWAALELAFAAALGEEVFGWPTAGPVDVLYVDGDLPRKHLRTRAQAMARARGLTLPQIHRLRLCVSAEQAYAMHKLDTFTGQDAMSGRAWGAKLVILDSLSSLTDSSEHGGERARRFREWLLKMRNTCAVVVVHHAGRHGFARGPDRQEDPYDAIVSLRQPNGWTPRSGLRAQLRVEKARDGAGEGLRAIDVRMRLVRGASEWAWQVADETPLDAFVRLWLEGLRDQGDRRQGGMVAGESLSPEGRSAGRRPDRGAAEEGGVRRADS